MKLKSLLLTLAGAAFLTSCSNVPTATIENLKAAATGETNASAHYAAFSKKAAEEGNVLTANMFAATSYAESLHAAKHLEELAKLGITDFTPIVEDFNVNTTIENLVDANNGEIYEFTTMYPGFIEIAQNEKANGAVISFDWANRAEIKHSGFYTKAINSLENPEIGDNGIVSQWLVCTKCGDTYMATEVGQSCELCGTPASSFKVFAL